MKISSNEERTIEKKRKDILYNYIKKIKKRYGGKRGEKAWVINSRKPLVIDKVEK